jgi:hypothetical protein
MALAHSPSIITNGLAFYYDMGNSQKSWRGAPTTNLLTNPNGLSTGSWSRTGVTVVDNSAIAPDGTLTASTLTATNTDPYVMQSINVTSGVTYAASTYVRATGQAVGKKGYLWWWIAGTATGTNTFSSTYTLTSEWQRIVTPPFTPTGSGTVFLRWEPSDAGQTPTTAIGDVYYSWGMQAEVSTFATPFVNGTRSNTQAILDLTNNNTVTANSLTYASNNTFSFNGTSDYIDTGNTFTFAQSSQFSAEVWLKILDHSDRPVAAAGIIGKGHYYDNQWDIWLYNNNSIYFETTGNPTRQGLVYLASPVLALNTWHHYVATYNNGAKSIYLNGNLVGTQAYTGPGDFSNTNNVLIGRRFNDASRSLRGDVSVAKIYNRALSAAEVQQNFNALRSRYGI